MDPIITSTVRDTLRELPLDAGERHRLLRRATEACAAREAAAAVDLAARRGGTGVIGDVLRAANTLQQEAGDGPAARAALLRAVTSGPWLDAMPGLIAELREIAGTSPGSGACTIASALQLWTWTTRHFLARTDCPESVLGELSESLAPLIAARCQILEAIRLTESSTPRELLLDLCHVQAARAAGHVATLCADLVHGYRRHPAWDAEGCASCYRADELDELEGLMPGFASSARGQTDVIESDGAHPPKAGPCVRFNDIEGFRRLRAKLDGCLTGARLAGDRAAAALAGTLAPAGRG